MRKEEKLHALAGVAAISAVIAMVLILSYLSVVVPMLSAFAIQLPTSAESIDDVTEQLMQIRVDVPNAMDAIALAAIGGFVFLAIASAVAASRMRKVPMDIAAD